MDSKEPTPANGGESSAAAERRPAAAAEKGKTKVSDDEAAKPSAEPDSTKEEEPVIQPTGMDIVKEAEWQTTHPIGMRNHMKLAAALTIFQPSKTRTDLTVHDRLHLLKGYMGPGAFDHDNNFLPLDWEAYHVAHPWSHRNMTSEELTRLEEEEKRRRADAAAKAAAAAMHGGWGSPSSRGAGTWEPPLGEEEEEPIEDVIARAEKEAAEEAKGPYGSPRPIGLPPSAPCQLNPHLSVPMTQPPLDHPTYRDHHLTTGHAQTSLKEQPTQMTLQHRSLPSPQWNQPHSSPLVTLYSLSISPQPIPQPPPTNNTKLLAFYACSPAIHMPPKL
ncbi:unnamed protein product [Closterium sp. NIES-53]